MEKRKYAALMKIAVILGCIFSACDFVFTCIVTHSFVTASLVQDAMVIVCLIFLLFSYSKHDKNLMNMMMGASLMAVVMLALQYSEIPDPSSSGIVMAHGVCDILLLLVLICAFFNHILSTFCHNTSDNLTTYGASLLAAGAFLAEAQILLSVFIREEFSLIHFLNWAAWYLMLTAVLAALVCVEIQLREFKREKAKTEKQD